MIPERQLTPGATFLARYKAANGLQTVAQPSDQLDREQDNGRLPNT
jgi:hypothetical protein